MQTITESEPRTRSGGRLYLFWRAVQGATELCIRALPGLMSMAPLCAGEAPSVPAAAASIRVAAVSCESRIRQTDFNLQRMEYWARRAVEVGADLVLFPESGIQGWWQSRENRQVAETCDGPSVQRLLELSRELDVHLAVGLTEKDNEKVYLTHLLLGPNGIVARHRKHQLAGGDQGEAQVWDRGDPPKVFSFRGRILGFAICYESVQPETCAALKAQGAEIILAPYANGTHPAELLDPKRRQRRWIWERVRESEVWYVGCDATPHAADGTLKPGAAFVIDPTGALVACTPADGEGEAMVLHEIPARQEPPR